LLKKSGGETQTPFYVAMLASFAQLYHINDRKWNCSRLIIFDEAFSKMDGERIRESIQLLKQTGFHPTIDVEDLNMITMQLDNGVIASYQQCHYTPDCCRNYTVIGTHGRIENYGDCGSESTVELWDQRVDDFRLRGDATFRTNALSGSHGGADAKIIQGFIDYVRDGKYPVTSPQAARYSVACGCAGAESIRAGGLPVDIKPLAAKMENYKF